MLNNYQGNRSFTYIISFLLCMSTVLLNGCQAETRASLQNPTKKTIVETPPEISPNKLNQIQENGVLVVGTAITKPFEFHHPETGALIGLDIDIANTIAEQLGVEIEYVEMSFANLIPALQDNKVDMTIAAMYITTERENLVDFSDPYLETGLVMVVHPETKIKHVEDLKGTRVGVKIGSTGANLAQEFNAQGFDLQVIEYKDTFDSLLDLEVNRVDVVFNDYLNTLTYLKESQSNLQLVVDEKGEIIYLSKVGLGIAVHKENHELVDFINDHLQIMKQTGEFQKIYETWLLPKGN